MNTKKIVTLMVLVAFAAPAWGARNMAEKCFGDACRKTTEKAREMTETARKLVGVGNTDVEECSTSEVRTKIEKIIEEIKADHLLEQTLNQHRPLNKTVRDTVDELIEMNECGCFTTDEQETIRTYIDARFGRTMTGSTKGETEAKQRNERKYKDRLYKCAHGVKIED